MKLNILLIVVFVLLFAGCANIQNCLFPANNVSDDSNNLNETIIEIVNEDDSFEIVLDEENELNEEEVLDEEEIVGDFLLTINVDEGELVSLANIQAVDPDGDEVTYTYSHPLNNEGEWQTSFGDAGVYVSTISASDGSLTTIESVKIIVNSVNKAPIISCKDSITVKEGDLIDLGCSFTDDDGDEITYIVKGFMDDLTYQTTYDDAGEYSATVIATDGNFVVEKEIMITIEYVNRVPEIILESKTITVTEGELAKVNLNVIDADGDDVVISFSEPFNANGEWQTTKDDVGTYEVSIIADDGHQAVKETFNVIVTELNLPPEIIIDDVLTFKEGDLITLPLVVEDENNDEVTINISGWMDSLTYQTENGDVGEYEVTITANDGVNEVSKTIEIIVEFVNRPPEFIVG